MPMTRAEQVEEQIYAEQQAYIEREFGKRAANVANYGWGVTDEDDIVIVSTKVYGHGVLTSQAEAPLWQIKHSMEEWNADDIARAD